MTTTTVPVTTTAGTTITPPAFNTGSSSADNIVNAIAWALTAGSSLGFTHGGGA